MLSWLKRLMTHSRPCLHCRTLTASTLVPISSRRHGPISGRPAWRRQTLVAQPVSVRLMIIMQRRACPAPRGRPVARRSPTVAARHSASPAPPAHHPLRSRPSIAGNRTVGIGEKTESMLPASDALSASNRLSARPRCGRQCSDDGGRRSVLLCLGGNFFDRVADRTLRRGHAQSRRAVAGPPSSPATLRIC